MKYEIWLGDDWSFYERGIAHMADGSACPLYMWVCPRHDDVYIKISYEERLPEPDFPVAWRTDTGLLELTHWDGKVESIMLHNTSSARIRIDGFQTLEPGESLEVIRNE